MAHIEKLPFRLENEEGDPIYGDVRFRTDVQRDGHRPPAVVMCHGFKGFKDWGTFPAWGEKLAEEGFVSVLFNFSLNGVGPEQPTEFTQLDRFAENTYTREVGDLAKVLACVSAARIPGPRVDAGRIGLVGHSRGGGIAILQAAQNERVRALVTWNAVSGFVERFTADQVRDWETRGFTEALNTRTGQVMRLNRTLYEDAKAHREQLNVLWAASRIRVPWLIVHAADDETVSVEEGEALAEAAPKAEFFKAMNGHTFGGKHPLEGAVPFTAQLVFNRTVIFLKKALQV